MHTIVLYKWQRPARRDFRRRRVVYTAEHVNKICSMLRRHLTIPYRVICLTDDPTDVGCETRPLPAAGLLKYGLCWNRLWLFSNEARALGDRLVLFDLDTVIVDNIDDLLDRSDPFIIWRGRFAGITYCGCMWMLETGTFPQVWEQFDASELLFSKIRNSQYLHPDCLKAGHGIGSDQAWIALKLPNMPTWGKEDGVLSYRIDAKGSLPKGAKVINFHGAEDPSLASCQKESPWILEHWN